MSTEVVVALIGAIAVVVAAGFGLLGVWISNVKKSIGEPDNNGNIVSMLTRLLDGQAGQDRRLAALEAGQADHSVRLEHVERQLSDRYEQEDGAA